ncbi:cutinase family protein [Hoyosella sp. YIM 151337]|uniref:cutinase family protein n=1 Tax=Hoyosella sp. YIM 151337 TaxID=2992742 RepID=UPI002235D051|nr:cutinase family protein [Hoyosella sp. YIM 151337]MCW4352100.1 cutinase family protein [Hoyosella sp. YIM 151337]
MIFAAAVRRSFAILAGSMLATGLTAPAAYASETASAFGSQCEAGFVLALRGSNEPPQDGASYDPPVYPAATATAGMGPLLSAFYAAVVKRAAERSIMVPTGYGVVYPAVRVGNGGASYFANYTTSIGAGAENLRLALQQINAACAGTGTTIVLAGNSQGADVINLALGTEARTPTGDFQNVASIVLFGDPSRADRQTLTAVGAQHGVGIFRILGLLDGSQDAWMREHPTLTMSFCIPGDNVCDPVEHPDDAANARGTAGITPLDRHLSYANPAVQLRCEVPGEQGDVWMSAKDCAAHLVADRLAE